MQKICPQCQDLHPGQFLCPRCGIQLLALGSPSTKMLAGYGEQGGPRPVGMATRFVAGLIFAQGAFYGMKLIGTGIFILLGVADGWGSGVGQLAQPALALTAALIGGMLAGAGNPRGFAAGAAVGLLHTLALVGTGFVSGRQPEPVLLYGGWAVLPLLAAVGGRYGRFLWPPLSDMFDLTPATTIKPAPRPVYRDPGPRPATAWLRVLAGAALAAAGTVWAGDVRDFIVTTSGGAFAAGSYAQVQFVTWVIAALAVTAGGAFAGASTGAGLRHGLLVGELACTAIFVLHLHVLKQPLQAEQFFATAFRLPDDGGHTAARLGLFLLTNSFGLSLFGGWIGATLLPRTVPSRLDRGVI